MTTLSILDIAITPFTEFSFMRRALAGGLALSVGAAPTGVFLMLRRMSLTGDAMSHAILPGAAIGFLMFGLSIVPMTIGGIVAGLLVALLSGLVARSTVLREDASLAAFYLLSLAAGVLIVSLQGSSIDLLHVLFGTILALDDVALYFIAGTATITLFVFAIMLRPLALECADPSFLRVVSGTGGLVHLVFLVLVVLNLVAGFQALGTLLSVGLMMLPAAAARFWVRGLGSLVAVSFLGATTSCYVGLILSYHARLPSGPTIILTAGLFYLGSLILGSHGGILSKLFLSRHRTG